MRNFNCCFQTHNFPITKKKLVTHFICVNICLKVCENRFYSFCIEGWSDKRSPTVQLSKVDERHCIFPNHVSMRIKHTLCSPQTFSQEINYKYKHKKQRGNI